MFLKVLKFYLSLSLHIKFIGNLLNQTFLLQIWNFLYLWVHIWNPGGIVENEQHALHWVFYLVGYLLKYYVLVDYIVHFGGGWLIAVAPGDDYETSNISKYCLNRVI